MTMRALLPCAVLLCLGTSALFAADAPLTDGEVWNEGVEYYRAGDVTNALRVLRPLMLSKSHGPRAAEVVAKLEHEGGNREEAAVAAQIALRANPGDERANRNFTRATDRLLEMREEKRVEAVLQAAQGKDPEGLLMQATQDARRLMTEAGTYRTNAAERAVMLSDQLSARARTLADAWIPLGQTIAQAVTNEEQAATIMTQIGQAQEKTKKAAKELSDFDATAYETMSDVEHDFTRFLKMVALPPTAIGEDIVAQSNAWQDVEQFNGRAWQNEALDYTRAFRAKFPAWAQAYEQQAQADTNKPPFTKEAQDRISALATELEKLQIECCAATLPPKQEEAIAIACQIRDLLPKDNSGKGGQGQPQQNPNQQNQNQPQNQDQQQQDQQDDQQQPEPEPQDQPEDKQDQAQPEPEDADDPEIEATLKKAQERNDEHEAEKKARMRKAPLPPNERDW